VEQADNPIKDLDVAAASLAPLPDDAEEGPSGPPSPVPQKKKLKVQPSSSKQAAAGDAQGPKAYKRWVWLLLLAALGAAAAGTAAGSVVACSRPHTVQLQPLCDHVQPAWHRLTQEQLPAARARLEAAAATARLQGRAVYWQLVRHATDLKASAQEHAQALQDKLQQGQLAALLQGLLPQPQQQPRRGLDTTPLSRLLPDNPAWQEVALDIREAVTAPRRPKALGLLLACGSEADCEATGRAVSAVQPAEGCVLSTTGYAPEEPAGALQAQLASFLSGCPQGVVVMTQAEQLSHGWWSVLVNALSEQGGFQHNGHVDASRALFVLLQQLPAEEVAGAAEHHSVDAVSRVLKQKWIEDMVEGAGGGEEVAEMLEPLRRRIDFAAPTRPQQPQADVAPVA
jgi:hypothetical protein